jgi:3-oxoacyl-[acyl-carrier protein] reductase
MTNVPPQNAIVTGASRGIGRAVALRLARDGFAVVVNYSSNRDKAAEVVAEIEGQGGRAAAVQADVADPAGVARLFDAAEQAHGRIGVVVNSAGIMKLSPSSMSMCAAPSTCCNRPRGVSPTAVASSPCRPACSG